MSNPRVWSAFRQVLIGAAVVLCALNVGATGAKPDLSALVLGALTAPAEQAYANVRKVWALWGETDALAVEEALTLVANNGKVAKPVQAYAEFLLGRARVRRGDLDGAQKTARELGYVSDWLVVGPFDNEGKAGLETEQGPEGTFDKPIVPGQVYTGKERPVAYRAPFEGAFPYGWLDGSSLFRPDQNVCFFATTFLETERARHLSLWVGNSGSLKVYVDGQVVLSDAAYRTFDVDRHGFEGTFAAGTHNVTLKVCGTEATPVVSLRVAQPDGSWPKPLGVTLTPTFSASADAVEQFHRFKLGATGLGPLARFRKLLQKKAPSAAELQAFAEYLVQTGSDDPAAHEARDLAKRASEKQPTVERLLLAGELAEDYNQERAWIGRAERLTGSESPSTRLLLARGRVERSGLNWRDAFPHYRAALEQEPSSYAALHGLVELYNEVGLRHTALQLLDDSLRREPNAVNVLNMYASQLEALGFHAEADQAKARYARLRFDDTSNLTERIELGLAQRDRASVEHWVARLLQLEPDSLWVHNIAARAYRQLAQPERAVASHQRALLLAPEDVSTLRALSDLYGELGKRNEQVRLLRQILEIRPQAKEVREYVEHIEPEAPKLDEKYAWSPEQFLKDRHLDARGEVRRTLLNLKVSTVYDNGLGSEFHQIVFQPLTDSAAALSRRYAFGFQADSQHVEIRGARVFRADGRVDEAVETGTDSADDPSIAMYTSTRAYYVQLPRLDPGDVVELMYRIDDVAPRNDYDTYFGTVVTLQSNEPIGHSEYVLMAPKQRKLYIEAKGIPGLERSVESNGKMAIHRFWADAVPPLVPEPAMPPWSEVLGHIHVSTYPDVKTLGRWYWGLVQDQFNLDQETRDLAQRITKGLTTEREKVAAVYNWVIKNTRYVALEFGIYGHKPRRCVQTVARGWGDCKDKATVIVSLLKELGIDATIVILRTQMRGKFDSAVSSLAPFDHAIAYVPSLDLYLDGTAEYTGMTELPGMDQEALGILVNNGDAKLVTLPLLSSGTKRHTHSRVKLRGDGSADIELDATASGASAPEWRRRYAALDKRRERVGQDVSKIIMGFELNNGAAALDVAVDDYEQPARVTAKGSTATLARVDGERLSLPVTVRRTLSEQYASLGERQLPVRLPVFGTESADYEVELPVNMQVLTGPEDVDVTTRFGSFSVQRTQEGRKVRIQSTLSVSVTRVAPKDYQAWRAFCGAADAALGTRLTVGKK
jgi:cellulose synthase operon protein C